MREANANFDSSNSCKRLEASRLQELHESKFPFVSRIEFIRSKLSNFSAHHFGMHFAGYRLFTDCRIGCRSDSCCWGYYDSDIQIRRWSSDTEIEQRPVLPIGYRRLKLKTKTEGGFDQLA